MVESRVETFDLGAEFVDSMVLGGGAIIASIISCGGFLSLERVLMIRGGLNFLLTGKPEALIGRTVYRFPVIGHTRCVVATELEALITGVELWSSCCAGPVDLVFPPRASSGESVAGLLFWRSIAKVASNSKHLIFSIANDISIAVSFSINSLTRESFFLWLSFCFVSMVSSIRFCAASTISVSA